MQLSALALSFIFSFNVLGYSDVVDANGGHTNIKLEMYHCHQDDCQHKTNKKKVVFKQQGYNRKQWRHWIDADQDCQNTRAEVLIATSITPVTFRNDKGCTVLRGKWYGAYSGKYWLLASDLDIDHIVPLYWAHAHGGSQWSKHQKSEFANTIENLLVIEDGLNQAKGAKGPDKWMPPSQPYQCEYVKKFNNIVQKYKLAYRSEERGYIHKFLEKCVK